MEPDRSQLAPEEVPDSFRVETPAAMLARLRAESAAKKEAARRAAMPYNDDLLVGSELTYLVKDDVFGAGRSALKRLFSRPSAEESVVVSHPLSVKEQVVRYQRPRTDHDPYVAVYTPLPHITEEQARKLMEKGFSNSSNVALDMAVQSHVGQGTPLLAMCGIMDSRTDDPNEALQVAGYFDLGRDRCDLISLPLINFPLNKEDFDDYMRGLYLCTMFHNVRGFQNNKALCSYSAVGFDQHKETPRCIRSRVKESWEDILARNNENEFSRVQSGQNLLNAIEKERNEAIPDVGAHQFACVPPSKGTPQTSLLTSDGVIKRPNFTLPRSASTRFTMPLNMRYSGRNSVDTARRSLAANSSDGSTSLRQDPNLLEGQGPSIDFTKIIFPTVIERNFSNPRAEIVNTIQQLYGDTVETLSVNPPESYSAERLIGKVFSTVYGSFGATDLVEGKVLMSVKIVDLLSSANLGALLLAEVLGGNLTMRVTALVTLNKYTSFALKLVYDELAQLAPDATNFGVASVLPGAIFPSQEKSFSFDFSIFSMGSYTNFRENEGFGRISLVALSSPNLPDQMPDSANITLEFSVVNVDTSVYNLGQGQCLDLDRFPVHVTSKSKSLSGGAKRAQAEFSLNLYELGPHFNRFQAICGHLAGYSGDLIVDWMISASALTNGRCYMVPVYDQNTFSEVSEEKLRQCKYVSKELSLNRSGTVHIPFSSSFGSYTKNKHPKLLFVFPGGISGPSGETIHVNIQVRDILNFSGLGHQLLKPILAAEGPDPFSFHLFCLHCGTLKTESLNKGGMWCVPVSPVNLAAMKHGTGSSLVFNESFVSKTHNWLHYMASCTAYWRGTLTYELRVTYNSRVNAVANLVAFYTSQVEDLFGFSDKPVGDTGIASICGDAFSVRISIPFVTPTLWLRTYRNAYDVFTSCNGSLYFHLPTSGVKSVQLFVRAESDFSFERFRALKAEYT
uniref:Polyprotein n=1 Tax=Cherry rasp leaf virus TaxID=202566 RepID=Q8JMH5_CRLV|nr:polyprotein [Cherry rasp leaf virus]